MSDETDETPEPGATDDGAAVALLEEAAADERAAAAEPQIDAFPASSNGAEQTVPRRKGRPFGAKTKKRLHQRRPVDGGDDAKGAASDAARFARTGGSQTVADLRERVRELEGKLESAQEAAVASIDTDLADFVGDTFGAIFDALAATRGEHWRLTNGGRARLGAKGAKALAPYMKAVAPAIPALGFVAAAWAEVGPRVSVDLKTMTPEQLTAHLAERDRKDPRGESELSDAGAASSPVPPVVVDS